MDSLTLQSGMATDLLATCWSAVRDQAGELMAAWEQDIDTLILCGCGDSYHAARSLEFPLSEFTGMRAHSVFAMQASRYLVPSLERRAPRCLLIGLSASGEVARTLEAVEIAGAMGMRTLAITCEERSSLSRTADAVLSFAIPQVPQGPGLLSYLASLLMGYSVLYSFSPDSARFELDRALRDTPTIVENWFITQKEFGIRFAEENPREAVVFLGSGPAYGSALFAAAKVIEASGMTAWGQDVEEWSHIEYFCEPAHMPTWLLSGKGRSESRELEIAEAAKAIGRRLAISTWPGGGDWSLRIREALAPLGLWAGPVAFASYRAAQIGEKPFRGFGGGRSLVEGGGASRIQNSHRITPEEAKQTW